MRTGGARAAEYPLANKARCTSGAPLLDRAPAVSADRTVIRMVNRVAAGDDSRIVADARNSPQIPQLPYTACCLLLPKTFNAAGRGRSHLFRLLRLARPSGAAKKLYGLISLSGLQSISEPAGSSPYRAPEILRLKGKLLGNGLVIHTAEFRLYSSLHIVSRLLAGLGEIARLWTTPTQPIPLLRSQTDESPQ